MNNDSYLNNFVNYCEKILGGDLTAIILYGSRYWGNSIQNSDYDMFIILKHKRNYKGIQEDVRKQFSKISPAYIDTIAGLKKRILQGEWAVYYVLKKHSRIIISNKDYKTFQKWLRNLKPNPKTYLKRYTKKRNREDLESTQKSTGWKFIKWAYLSIMKRIFLVSYCRFGKSPYNFLKDLEKNKDIFTKQEMIALQSMHKKYYHRKTCSGKKQRDLWINLLKKINNEIEKLQ